MVVVSKLSIAAILLTWTGFTALKGNTKYVHSYVVTNLISGAKIMNIVSLDWKMITWLLVGTGPARGGPRQSGSCHEGHFLAPGRLENRIQHILDKIPRWPS